MKKRADSPELEDASRRRLLTYGLLLGLGVPLVPRAHEAGGFEAFKQQHLQAFNQYETALREAFAEYQRLHEAAFADYRQRLTTKWDDPEVTEPKQWAEYTDDLESQRVVDFDKNEIRLTTRTDKPKPQSLEAIKQQLAEVLAEDEQTANARDPVTQQVERQLLEKAEVPVEKDEPPAKKPVLSELFDKPQPSEQDVAKKTEELIKDAKREQVTAKKSDDEGGWAERVTVSLPADRPLRKAKEYLDEVKKRARQNQIGQDLILAIMHTESAFNPRARSHVPAYGLMQIVPRSAGMDASQAIYGKARVLSPSYLYNAEKNIHVGATYLNILYYRYLRAIENPESRIYCAISAYNTGAGNVAKTFTNTTSVSRAARTINRQQPKQVYQYLVENLPYEETQHYLQRVVRRMNTYRDI